MRLVSLVISSAWVRALTEVTDWNPDGELQVAARQRHLQEGPGRESHQRGAGRTLQRGWPVQGRGGRHCGKVDTMFRLRSGPGGRLSPAGLHNWGESQIT